LHNTVAAGFSRPANVRLKADATCDFTEAANMTYYGGKELAAAFRTVRKNTIQIAEDIPEEKYDFKATPESRTIRQTLAHIGVGTMFPTIVHGGKLTDMNDLDFQEFIAKIGGEESKPRSKAEIIAMLKADGDKFAALLESFPESFLAESVAMRPGGDQPKRTRFDMLLSAKEHEMHHRGQLMVLQRMVGVTPHLTRLMQERMARMQAQAATK
jgi:uncharacterized damage-inducible protein DinB